MVSYSIRMGRETPEKTERKFHDSLLLRWSVGIDHGLWETDHLLPLSFPCTETTWGAWVPEPGTREGQSHGEEMVTVTVETGF